MPRISPPADKAPTGGLKPLRPTGARYLGPWACTHKGDLRRPWCVRYKLLVPGKDGPRWRTVRISAGINAHSSLERRSAALCYVLAVVRAQLEAGTIHPGAPLPVLKAQPEGPGLLAALRQLLPILAAGRSPKTALQQRYALNLLAEYLALRGELALPAAAFSPAKAQDFSDYLLARRAEPEGKPLAPRTHNNALDMLSTLCRALGRRGQSSTRAFESVSRLKAPVGRNLAYPPELRDRLLEYLAQHDLGLYRLVLLLYGCFVRPRIEARAIRLEDIDLKHQRLLIRAAASKSREQQAVAIPRHTLRALLGVDFTLPSSYYLFGPDLLPSAQPMATNTAYVRHRAALDALGITGPYALYSWKDTGNRDAANAGVPLHELMLQNRHTDLSVTTKYFKRLGLQVSERMAGLDLMGGARQLRL